MTVQVASLKEDHVKRFLMEILARLADQESRVFLGDDVRYNGDFIVFIMTAVERWASPGSTDNKVPQLVGWSRPRQCQPNRRTRVCYFFPSYIYMCVCVQVKDVISISSFVCVLRFKLVFLELLLNISTIRFYQLSLLYNQFGNISFMESNNNRTECSCSW